MRVLPAVLGSDNRLSSFRDPDSSLVFPFQRERHHSIPLFDESKTKAFRMLEAQVPEVTEGFGNDFPEAMEDVDLVHS